MDGEHEGRGIDWRILIVGGVGLYGIFVFGLCELFSELSLQEVLQVLGVPALSDLFLDLRGVAKWFALSANGIDPRTNIAMLSLAGGGETPTFLMNYPASIFLFSWLGLSSETEMVWGWGLLVLYFCGVLLLAGRLRFGDALLWVLFVLSPLSVMLVERANLDIVLFFLLVLAVVFYRYPLVSSFCILGAAVLKLFPVVGLSAVLFSGTRRGIAVAMGASVLFLGYLFLIRNDLSQIATSLSNQVYSSFGVGVIAGIFGLYGKVGNEWTHFLAQWFRVAGFVVVVGCWAGGRFFDSGISRSVMSVRARFSLLMGGAIFLFLFLFGPQMDYKWVFLLFVLPGVLELVRGKESWEARVGKVWIFLALGYSYWTFFSNETSLRNAVLKQLVAWLLVGVSSFLVGGVMKSIAGEKRAAKKD